MKRSLTQAQVDEIRNEYIAWDKFGAESETAVELAKRLGISKSTLYRLAAMNWQVDGSTGHVEDRPQEDLGPVVRWLTAELVAARLRIAELEREPD